MDSKLEISAKKPLVLPWEDAVSAGDVTSLRKQHDSGSWKALRVVRARGDSVAHAAAWNGNIKVLQCLHQLAPDLLALPTEKDIESELKSWTPAHFATANDQPEALRYLHTVVPQSFKRRNAAYRSPSHLAASKNKLAALRCLSILVPETFRLCRGIPSEFCSPVHTQCTQ